MDCLWEEAQESVKCLISLKQNWKWSVQLAGTQTVEDIKNKNCVRIVLFKIQMRKNNRSAAVDAVLLFYGVEKH